MKNITLFNVVHNRKIAADVYELLLSGDSSQILSPGQFVNIKLPELYLRRPISIADFGENSLTLIYKAVGEGTEKMGALQKGDTLDILLPLGNGFNVSKCHGKVVLIGGGVGTPPLYGLCKALLAKDIAPSVVLGFGTEADVFYADEFKGLGVEVAIATADGSIGDKGFVTDVLRAMDYDYYYTCGPVPMLDAVKALGKQGQLSYEERMGCGFGACMGCSCETKYGYKRICVEGPVFNSDEI